MEKNTLRFRLNGMSCASCSARIQRVLNAMPEVEEAAVNLATASGTVSLKDGIDAAALIPVIEEKVAGLGFSAQYILPETDMQTLWDEEQKLQDEDIARRKRRLAAEFIFALPLLVYAMGAHMGLPLPSFLAPHDSPLTFALVQLLLTLPVLWSGRDFYRVGIPNLLRGGPNMDSLVALGTGTAFLYSLWSTAEIAAGNVHLGLSGLYYESAAVLIALISLGKYLEAISKVRTKEALRGLMDLTPEEVNLVGEDGSVLVVPAAHVLVGDMLVIRSGTRIPVDGSIVEGHSSIDMSSLTGESIPVSVEVGDTVSAGTMNTGGVFTMRAERVGSDTVLSRIIRLVREAQGSKAPIASLADKISLYFVPTVICIALAAGLAWYFGKGLPFGDALRIFVAVLVVACPCALGLATPMSIMVATGQGAKLGILIKNGTALELAGKLDTLVFDKTGTLTEGKPVLKDIIPVNAAKNSFMSRFDVLTVGASLEEGSDHPLGIALKDAAANGGNTPYTPLALEEFEEKSGRGISAAVTLHGKKCTFLLGSRRFLTENGISVEKNVDDELDALSEKGQTPLLLGLLSVKAESPVNGERLADDDMPENLMAEENPYLMDLTQNIGVAAIFAIADTLRKETPFLVNELKKLGIRVILLSGDHRKTAQAIAAEAGITPENCIAEVLPDDKEAVIAKLQQESGKKRFIGMVGDGINDAPALARADVGMAMGNGMDIAMDAGDMVLLKGLIGVLTAVRLSRATLSNIRLSLFWAFAYNVLLLPVAAGGLMLFGGPAMSPEFGGAAMALSSVSVVLNALRLKNIKD